MIILFTILGAMLILLSFYMGMNFERLKNEHKHSWSRWTTVPVEFSFFGGMIKDKGEVQLRQCKECGLEETKSR